MKSTKRTTDLIEPYWNVKKEKMQTAAIFKNDLIEPYWNVKTKYMILPDEPPAI